MGAIGEGGVLVRNEEVLRRAGVTPEELAEVEQRERAELDRRALQYRAGRPRTPVAGRTAVIVDDGIATGSTARAACQVARAQRASRVVLAIPVAPPAVVQELECDAEVVCVETHEDFLAVGQWYRDFSPISDDDVITLMDASVRPAAVSVEADTSRRDPPVEVREVEVLAGRARLAGQLCMPDKPAGIVVFAHASGSAHYSSRSRFVSQVLSGSGLATLLLDLLTRDEELDRSMVFDIEFLTGRLILVTGWLRNHVTVGELPVGYLGSSTGAAAALWAAANRGPDVAAVVSGGGRPDLAETHLGRVRAPTLLIVGGRDYVGLELNRPALAQLRCESRLVVVPGANYLFEEPGALAITSDLARDWLLTHLAAMGRSL